MLLSTMHICAQVRILLHKQKVTNERINSEVFGARVNRGTYVLGMFIVHSLTAATAVLSVQV